MIKIRFKYYLEGEFVDKPEPIFSMPMGEGHSDVSGETLLKAGHPLPLFPAFETWRREVCAKRRCGRCWQVTRGKDDLARHVKFEHKGAPIYLPEGAAL